MIHVDDHVFSRAHRGEIVVVRSGKAGVVGRKLRKDGKPSAAEVVVELADVRMVRPSLLSLCRERERESKMTLKFRGCFAPHREQKRTMRTVARG